MNPTGAPTSTVAHHLDRPRSSSPAAPTPEDRGPRIPQFVPERSRLPSLASRQEWQSLISLRPVLLGPWSMNGYSP